MNPQPPLAPIVDAASSTPADSDPDWLSSCVHCGFCLDSCPTYRITGDENNSPRGRLRLWKQEAQGLLPPDVWTDHYTRQCVGCLACETACPAAVPYGQILQQVRGQHLRQRRSRLAWSVRVGDYLARRPALFSTIAAPLRLLRRSGWAGRKWFGGQPAVWQSTADFARHLVDQHRPTGPRVALFSGCLMDAAFREINFATVQVLVRNNYHVVVPSSQTCCGALQHHIGSGNTQELTTANRHAFNTLDVDVVVTNAAGCGLELARSLSDLKPVIDVIDLLDQQAHPLVLPNRTATLKSQPHLYLDLPCHRLHGSRNTRVPERLLNALGCHWDFAPDADHCCGAGGTYHIEQPQMAAEILRRKSEFLDSAEGDPVILATMNHVCMMQWHSAITQHRRSSIRKRWQVRHMIQLLNQPRPND